MQGVQQQVYQHLSNVANVTRKREASFLLRKSQPQWKRTERWIEHSCTHICERQDKIKEEEEEEREGRHPRV